MPHRNLPSTLEDDISATAPEAATRQSDQGPFLLDLGIILADRKRTILQTTLIVLTVAVIASFVWPSSYTANVTLLPPQQSSSLGAALASQLGNLGGMAALAGGSGLGLKDQNDTFVAMLKSRTVEDAMVQHFGLMAEYRKRLPSDARRAFERHASVDANAKDGLIHISVQDRNPARAAELANGYVDQFRTLSEHLAISEAGQRRLFFQIQLEDAKNHLADAEEALKATEQKTGLIQLDSQARALIESAAALRAQVAAKEVQIQSMQTFAADGNSQLVQAQKELQSLRAQLAKLGGSADIGGDELIVPKGKVTEAGLEYVRKLRDVKYYETIFEILARQFEAAKLDEARQGAIIQVVDSAVAPDKRSFPKRWMFAVGGLLIGLLLGTAFALGHYAWRDLQADPVKSKKIESLMWHLTHSSSSTRARRA